MDSAKNRPMMKGKQKGIAKLCKNSSQKLNTFARIDLYMGFKKRKTIMKDFATSFFGCWYLVQMLHTRGLNNKIISLHERTLRIKYGDKNSFFSKFIAVYDISLKLATTGN